MPPIGRREMPVCFHRFSFQQCIQKSNGILKDFGGQKNRRTNISGQTIGQFLWEY
jgi:hypothetical protein